MRFRATLRDMRKGIARLTVPCPLCGDQLIVNLRFPIPEHRDIKKAEVIRFRCGPDCEINEAQIRELLRI